MESFDLFSFQMMYKSQVQKTDPYDPYQTKLN